MENIVTISTHRSDYSAEISAEKSITVEELIYILEEFDGEDKIVFSNDNGYTFGSISERDFQEYVEEVE